MVKIKLTKGFEAVVDDEDFWIGLRPWFADVRDGQVYASANRPKAKGEPRGLIRMHQAIMLPPVGFEVDHINGDTLDNRRSNLRVVNKSQNQRNRSGSRFKPSRYKGVSKGGGGWRSCIHISGKAFEVRGFKTEEEAALNYDCLAIANYGEYARTSLFQDYP